MKRHKNGEEHNEVTITIVTLEILNMTIFQAQTNIMSNTTLLEKSITT